jgi:hypothetical protein
VNFVTAGGVTVGLCILAYEIVSWWPGRKALMKDPLRHAARLLPFLASWCYGCLTTLGIGGLVGLASSTVLGISNWLGDAALIWGVGGTGGQLSARQTFLPLSGPGIALMLIITAGFIAAVVKAGRSGNAGVLKRGAWCGITLGTSAGVAGFAAVPLAQAVNTIAGSVYQAV